MRKVTSFIFLLLLLTLNPSSRSNKSCLKLLIPSWIACSAHRYWQDANATNLAWKVGLHFRNFFFKNGPLFWRTFQISVSFKFHGGFSSFQMATFNFIVSVTLPKRPLPLPFTFAFESQTVFIRTYSQRNPKWHPLRRFHCLGLSCVELFWWLKWQMSFFLNRPVWLILLDRFHNRFSLAA